MFQCIVRSAKEKFPSKTAIIFKNQNITYCELENWIQCAELKIKKYKRISFIPYFCVESLVLIFAALRSNIKICLLNHRNPENYNRQIADQFRADISIISLQDLQGLIKNLPTKTLSEGLICDEPNICIPTSGSSSIPKIACLSYKNFLSNALVVNQKLNFSFSDTWILSLPLFHVAGISVLFRVFSAMATLSIAIDKKYYNIEGTFISLVPTQFKTIIDSHHLYRDKFKCILIGGAHLNAISFIEAKKLNLPLAISYGMTETASQILVSKSPQLIDGLYYLGLPSDHCKILLNCKMQLHVKGASVFYNYYNKKKPFEWFKTQDILKYHEEYGYAFFARTTEMFISGGENVYPEEIEREILKCSNVDLAYVIGVQNTHYGQLPVAFISGKNYSINEIKKHLTSSLAKYKVPVLFLKIPLQYFNGLKCSRRKIKKFVKNEKNMFVKLKNFI